MRSSLFDDIYFSGDGLAETRHVFLDGNNLAARFRAAPTFVIGETGFGTGLNFLAAVDLWRSISTPQGARLHYISFEQYPLSLEDMARAHAAWTELAHLSARLRALLPPLVEGLHRIHFDDDVTLTLGLGEAGAMLGRLEARVDAWFFDGFSPAKNPALWRADIFREAARLSAPGATFATFTVAGEVRRNAIAAGFAIEKAPGFGAKRNMLTGHIATPPKTEIRAPFHSLERLSPLSPPARVAVIGGGVAGASLAFALKRAGFAPTIFDPRGLASGASGNRAGLIMPRLDLGDGPAARFFRTAYLHAARLIDQLTDDQPFYHPCGVELVAADEDAHARQRKLLAAEALPLSYMRETPRGLFFPQAGVIDPRRFVAALADDATIDRRGVARIDATEHGVTLAFDDGCDAAFDACVIANGREALRFVEARSLPLSGVAGQIDWWPDASPPPHAMASGPYVAPTPGGGLVAGATYDALAADAEPATRAAASAENLAAVQALFDAGTLRLEDAQPRASVRCQTPDRLPVAGPVPDWAHYGAEYDDLRTGRQGPYPPAQYQPRLFILAGLGSRGLVTAPLLAELVVAAIAGAPAPVEADVSEALHPARFFIRDLKRARRILPDRLP